MKQSLAASMGLLATVLAAAVVVLAGAGLLSNGEVDSAPPDLSMFKLKHIGDKEVSQRRADEPVNDPALGAQIMRESLYLNDFQVRCISYGHLLRLIAVQSAKGGHVGSLRPIKQDAIEALAIVADVDRELYYELFRLHKSMPELLTDAIGRLEAVDTFTARDTSLDLVECARTYFPEETRDFLSEPGRARTVANFKEFKTVFLGHDEWVAQGKLAPRVDRLARKYDGAEPNLRPISERDLEAARAKIESFDDQELSLARRAIASEASDAVEVQPEATGQQVASDEVVGHSPSEPVKPIDARKAEAVAARLAILTFACRRADQIDRKRPTFVKLSFSSASDFVVHWTNLSQLAEAHELDEAGAELAGRVLDFLADPKNQRVAKRMQKSVENLKAIAAQLDKLSSQEKFSSAGELEREYEHLIELLDQVDEALDKYDLLRALSAKKMRDLHEYRTVNKFIDDSLAWW